MPEKLIACSHPGKIGDCLYILPSVKKICERDGVRADIYSSEYCSGLKRLMEYQPYVNSFQVCPGYTIADMGCGVQPWTMPIPEPERYSAIYQMGFRDTPDCAIPLFIARSVGLDNVDFPTYEYPNIERVAPPYIVVAARGHTTYDWVYEEMMEYSDIPIVQTGAEGQAVKGKCIDLCGLDFLETLSVISRAKAFVSIPSAEFVLANGFPDLLKIGIHNGESWRLDHLLYSEQHKYLVNPSGKDILNLIADLRG